MLLVRSVCHQVSNQADKLDLLAIFITDVSPTYSSGLPQGRLFPHCPEEAHLNRWAKRRLIIKIARRSNLSA